MIRKRDWIGFCSKTFNNARSELKVVASVHGHRLPFNPINIPSSIKRNKPMKRSRNIKKIFLKYPYRTFRKFQKKKSDWIK